MNRTRTIILATVATLLLLAFAACSSGNSAPTTKAPAAKAPTPQVQATATSIPANTPLPTPIPTAAPEPDAAFGEPFQIKVGQTVSVGSTDLQFTFFEVSEDSHCPSDVVCIWAGQIVVVVVLEAGGDDLYSEILIVGNAEESSKKIGDYTVEAVDVEPYPVSTRTIDPTNYALTLKVSET